MLPNNKEEKNRESLKAYSKFSGLILQMIAMVLIGVFGGKSLDELLVNKFPLFTVAFTLLSAFLALWYMFRVFLKK